MLDISIHALREEGDANDYNPNKVSEEFLSTPSARRATSQRLCFPVRLLFLSTPSARRATLFSIVLDLVSDRFLSTPSARRATRVTSTTGISR